MERCWLISCILLLITNAEVLSFQPMVAFICDQPAVYLRSENDWQKVEDMDCLQDPADILNFCRRMYPDKEITNVVENSAMVKIDNWCQFGETECVRSTHTVRPLKCTVGQFESEALLVPEHCIFDNMYDERQCNPYASSMLNAERACVSRGMELKSSAPLNNCGIDMFRGIEFVCCPEDVTTTPAPVYNAYEEYLRHPADEEDNEHDFFLEAKTALFEQSRATINKLMQEWAEARKRVHDMQASDPKGADKLNKDINARFEKTYDALEQERVAEHKQLVSLHNQRVQAQLNAKKRDTLEDYLDALGEREPRASVISKSLMAYIRAEQKDTLHSLNHYRHLLDVDPAEAELIRQQTADHFEVVNQRIRQAVDMLSHIPKLRAKLRDEIDAYLRTFYDLKQSAEKLLHVDEESEQKESEEESEEESESEEQEWEKADEYVDYVDASSEDKSENKENAVAKETPKLMETEAEKLMEDTSKEEEESRKKKKVPTATLR